MRLDVTLVHGRGPEVPLDDDLRLGEPLLDVAFFEDQVRSDIARLARLLARRIGEQVFVQERRARPHRLANVHHRRQQLVIDLDEPDRLRGDVRARRRDRGEGVTAVERLVPGHDVAAHVAEVHVAPLAQVRDAAALREIRGRDHREHPRQRRRLARVNGLDPRVGMRTAQHLAMRHPRQLHVRAIHRAPRHLVHPIRPHRPRPNHPILRGVYRHHLTLLPCKCKNPAPTVEHEDAKTRSG